MSWLGVEPAVVAVDMCVGWGNYDFDVLVVSGWDDACRKNILYVLLTLKRFMVLVQHHEPDESPR